MYEAFHRIVPVVKRDEKAQKYDVVGPVCESGDWLGRDRELAIAPGDLLAICSAGAYGFVMSSNYNTRPRAAEIMVDGERARLVREREEVTQLFAGESILPD
jgi:diaminopimelate decarboxylase